jgi:hypothetical protein
LVRRLVVGRRLVIGWWQFRRGQFWRQLVVTWGQFWRRLVVGWWQFRRRSVWRRRCRQELVR